MAQTKRDRRDLTCFSAPPELVEAARRQAQGEGVSLSAFIRDALAARIADSNREVTTAAA